MHFLCLQLLFPPGITQFAQLPKHWRKSGLFTRVPQKLNSDQGRNFENVIKELCKVYNVEKSHMTTCGSREGECIKRFNKMFHQLLKYLQEDYRRKWSEHLTELVVAYNSIYSTLLNP